MAAAKDSVITLEQFVSEHEIPATVEVAEGLYATNIDRDFSIGDVIKILPAKHAPRLRGQPPREVEIVTRHGGMRKTLPVSWPIFVRPVTTGGEDFQQPMDLAELYGQGFPVLVETVEGTFQPKGTAVRIQKGVRLSVYYDLTVRTVLARDQATRVAIRESYRGVFEKRPQVYPTVHDLYISETEGKVRATKTVPVSHPDLDSVFLDDVITPAGKKGKVPCSRQPSGHVEYLLCTREQRTESGRLQVEPIRIPLSMVCPFEEILEEKQKSEFTLRELFQNGRPELPVRLGLVRGDPRFPDKTLAYMDTITVEGIYDEGYVVASEYDNESPDKPIFEIPLHAGLKVKHLVKLYTELDDKVKIKYYPIERLPEHIYLEKRTLVSAYEDIEMVPPVPPRPRGVRSFSTPDVEATSPTEVKVPPVPKHGSEAGPKPVVVTGRPRQASLPDDWLGAQGRGDSGALGFQTSTLPAKPSKLRIKKGFKKLMKRVKEGPLSPREHPDPKTGYGNRDGPASTYVPDRFRDPDEWKDSSDEDDFLTQKQVYKNKFRDPDEYEWIDSSDEDDDYLTPVCSPTDQAAMSLPAQLMKTALIKQLSHVSEEGDSDGSYVTPVTSPTASRAAEFSDDDDDSSDEYLDMNRESEFGTVTSLKQFPRPASRHSGFSDPTAAEKTIPPKDYNILDFSAQDMTRLLRYFHFSEDTVQSFHAQGITGSEVLKMTERQMAQEFYMDDFQVKMLSHFVEKTKEINKIPLARRSGSDC
ncbi:Cell-cycle sustaining protein [Branchiostoma belcheri]|nr:Cell-cycle sustaining protein [Branchiostoma belcheri]